MTDNEILVGLTSIVVLGVGAQWVARRLNFPSLLLLLPAGLAAGSTGLVQPEELLGDTLFPLVTMLVALLLFQSGLDLRLDDLPRAARGPVVRLVTIGLAVTFGGASAALVLGTDMPVQVALVLGAVLTVSGPTVVGPLLRVIRPRSPTAAVLAWEGTVLDPVGATLGVVVLNLVLASQRGSDIHPALQALGRLGLGLAIGLLGAAVLVFVLSRFLLTDDMEAAVAVLVAVACFGVAEVVMSEAGLFSTVALGVIVANQRVVPTTRIRGFGRTLEVLIIGILFILLGALVDVADIWAQLGAIAVVVGILVLVVRPLAVALSQLRSGLPGRDRALAAWMAPRGIVAAATAAQFAPSLADARLDSSLMAPVAFGVILGTGLVYGLTAAPLAGRLGVREPPPRAIALIGSRPWMLDLASCLDELGAEVVVVTTTSADELGRPRTPMRTVSVLDSDRDLHEHLEEVPLESALVATDHAAAVTLVVAELVEHLGRSKVLVLPRHDEGAVERLLEESWTPQPFSPGATLEDIDRRVAEGATLQVVAGAVPAGAAALAAVRADGSVDLRPGMHRLPSDATVVCLVDPA